MQDSCAASGSIHSTFSSADSGSARSIRNDYPFIYEAPKEIDPDTVTFYSNRSDWKEVSSDIQIGAEATENFVVVAGVVEMSLEQAKQYGNLTLLPEAALKDGNVEFRELLGIKNFEFERKIVIERAAATARVVLDPAAGREGWIKIEVVLRKIIGAKKRTWRVMEQS